MRTDGLIYILPQVVIVDYRPNVVQIQIGACQTMYLSDREKIEGTEQTLPISTKSFMVTDIDANISALECF